MKKILIFLLLVSNLCYSVNNVDSLYPVRVTLFTPLMSEKYLPGHIEAEILDVNKLPLSIKTIYNFTKSPKKGGDYYYVNYWPSGNKKPVINASQKYKGVKTVVIYLNESQLSTFIKNANILATKISGLTWGDCKKGYNLLKNNCADALSRALGLNSKDYKSLGVTIPSYVYKGITEKKY